jgi:cell wall-associated NlpC family hydrolase
VSARTQRARHRAARRPLSALTQGVTDGIGRRAAVVAATGGIIASALAGATSAQATPVGTEPEAARSAVDLNALREQARAALRANPAVTVAADATISVDQFAEVEITPAPEPPKPAPKPKPEPKPEPEPVEEAEPVEEEPEPQPEREAEEPAPAVAVEVSGSGVGAQVASIALRYVGTPYVVGGASPAGFDCSGLVSYVYAQVGIDLPHQSTGILNSPRTTVISAAEARPGDLLWSPGHIGIYIGDGKQVDASRPDGWNTDIRPIWQSNPTWLRVR